ncbi:LptF/LptG family permease [Hymenobacter sp. BT683]|uniref:LptF/LptG family permease n=1 Tax=Hymenobacter jeongseonensis TaxID=2791027 RepID=A0ABS0IKS1_9BACT|nr:LptF/LptG family permease [Hymenobacter jeongseonensis]MBF9238975.1 LptF/LptG family permease [Hymenobacter jeongseonensis]
MLKKLDKLILKAFAGPFLLTFAVVQFILLTHTLLKYLDDIIGKDLGTGVLLQLLFYFSVLIVPVSLPLAVLLSSLMTYGNLGEHHELTAIKASGIALTRILLPVFLLTAGLAVGAFWFNETIVPRANLKAYSLLWDVRQQKLALDIREGVFYNGIPGYTIKVDRKSGENGDRLHGVMIYDHTQQSGNAKVMLADSGRMFTRFNGGYLGLELFHGHNYVEQPDAQDRAGASFVRQGFDHNMVTFSLASFGTTRTPEDLFKENRMMLNIAQLHTATDSVQKKLHVEQGQLTRQTNAYYTFLRFDTTGRAANRRVEALQVPASRLAVTTAPILQQAANRANNMKAFATSSAERMNEYARSSALFRIEVYRKYSQSMAVLLMFLIGAPLGSIIKKGGLGVPILVSILFFIIYYVLSIMGEKYGREFVMPVGIGMWMSNLVLLPAGLFFLYQAYNDSGLLEMDFWRRLPQRLGIPALRKITEPAVEE